MNDNRKIEAMKRFIVSKTFALDGKILYDNIRNPPKFDFYDIDKKDLLIIAKCLNRFGFTVNQRVIMGENEVRYFYETMSIIIKKIKSGTFLIYMIDEEDNYSSYLVCYLN